MEKVSKGWCCRQLDEEQTLQCSLQLVKRFHFMLTMLFVQDAVHVPYSHGSAFRNACASTNIFGCLHRRYLTARMCPTDCWTVWNDFGMLLLARNRAALLVQFSQVCLPGEFSCSFSQSLSWTSCTANRTYQTLPIRQYPHHSLPLHFL